MLARILLADCWKTALTAACACVSPSGREWERKLALGILRWSGSFSPGEKVRIRVFNSLLAYLYERVESKRCISRNVRSPKRCSRQEGYAGETSSSGKGQAWERKRIARCGPESAG